MDNVIIIIMCKKNVPDNFLSIISGTITKNISYQSQLTLLSFIKVIIMNNSEIKVVLVTRSNIRHQIFLSKCCDLFPYNIKGIFIQTNKKNIVNSKFLEAKLKLYAKFKRYSQIIKSEIKKNIEKQNVEDILLSYYKDISVRYWEYVNSEIYEVDNINSNSSFEILRKIKPDLIVVFGGKILKNEWISIPRLGTINMHYGILPYYRSSASTEWAIFQENFSNVGITVHYIDKGVDTGPIISKHYIDPFQSSSFSELMAQVYIKGIDAIINTAKNIIKSNRKIDAIKEHYEEGYYPKKIFNTHIDFIARLRMYLIHKYEWPYFENFFESKANEKITKILYKTKKIFNKKQSLQNGIYIFLYHSIVDFSSCNYWEKICTKVMTEKAYFNEHLNWLSDHAISTKLSEIPNILKKGNIDKPYFVITFDDGYKNIMKNTLSTCNEKKIFPTVFVNANFTSTNFVYYRILCALLINGGYGNKIKEELEGILNINIPKSKDIFGFTKNNYKYQLTEKSVYNVWNKIHGNNKNQLNVHLDWNDLSILQENGWEIGNHTLSHPTLSNLSYSEQKDEIEANYSTILKNNIKCIKWLSIPNGSAKHSNKYTFQWLNENKNWNAIFANGGINYFPTRTEWFRIGIGNENLLQFIDKIKKNEYIMNKVLKKNKIGLKYILN